MKVRKIDDDAKEDVEGFFSEVEDTLRFFAADQDIDEKMMAEALMLTQKRHRLLIGEAMAVYAYRIWEKRRGRR